MPTYSYIRKDGQIIQKLFSIKNVPNQIVCQDGQLAVKIFKPCNFSYKIDKTIEEDKSKRFEQQKNYMNRYGVEEFQPLKGQSEQQTKKDFQQLKYKLQQQLEQKAIERRKKNKEQRQKKKKSFNETARLYFKGLEQKKQRQYSIAM